MAIGDGNNAMREIVVVVVGRGVVVGRRDVVVRRVDAVAAVVGGDVAVVASVDDVAVACVWCCGVAATLFDCVNNRRTHTRKH